MPRAHHRLAADPRRRHCPAIHVDLEADEARPPHFEALLDDIVVAAARRLVEFGDDAGEGRDRAPRRRVLCDAVFRREHPRMEVPARLRDLAAVEEGRPALAERRPPGGMVGFRLADRRKVANRHEIVRDTGVEDRRAVILEIHLAGHQAECSGNRILARRLRRLGRQHWQVEGRVAGRVRTKAHATPHRPDLFLEHQHHLPLADSGRGTLQPEEHGGPDRRVAGKRQFPRRGEDADRGAMHGVRRRRDEHRLRQVEFAGDRLHPRVVEATRIEHHGELVAGEWPVGEDVEDGVAAGHVSGIPAFRRPLSGPSLPPGQAPPRQNPVQSPFIMPPSFYPERGRERDDLPHRFKSRTRVEKTMNKLATAALAAVIGAAPILATATSASADSRQSYRNGKPVHSRQHYNNGHNNNWNNGNNNWQGVGVGLAAGAALGLGAGLLINRPPPPPVYYAPAPPPVVYYRAPAPVYYAPPPPPPVYYDQSWTEAHIEWCLDRYRSYNPATNTFMGYDGYAHECRGPY